MLRTTFLPVALGEMAVALVALLVMLAALIVLFGAAVAVVRALLPVERRRWLDRASSAIWSGDRRRPADRRIIVAKRRSRRLTGQRDRAV